MKKIYLISLLLIISLNQFCQTYWTKHPDNPVMEPGSPGEWDQEFIAPGSVIYYDGMYHMWYTGGIYTDTLRIGHATSPDGITWSKNPNNPILDVGPEGAWDENSLMGGYVLIIDAIFHMWYTGHSGTDFTRNYRIGHATSHDGVTWEKDANNPVLDMGLKFSWDDTWISGGHVLYDGSEYHIWYSGFGSGIANTSSGHATSPDAVTWTKDAQNPVLTSVLGSWGYPRTDLPSVVFDGTTYHGWYFAGHIFASQIGYATSDDGSNWTKYDDNPVVIEGSTGTWDAKSVGFCSVVDSAGIKYKMWYSGSNTDETGSIGYAESDSSAIDFVEYVFSGLSLYPNPTYEVLTIETTKSGHHTTEITSLNGQLLYSSNNVRRSYQIDLSFLQKGLYFITIRSRDYVRTEKIIKL